MGAVADAPDDGALRRAAVRGSTITVAGQGLSALIRFGSNLVITRLLLPEHFGVMAIVNVFILGLHLFSDIGVGPSIIQSKRGDDPVYLDTAWTVQVVRGFGLWVVACALAWPVARLYDSPELLWLLPVAGVTAVIGGFESTKLFTLNRSLSFLRITVLDLVTQLVAVATMILAGWLLRSVWSLVISAIVSSTLRTVLSHAMLPGHRNGFAWDADARRSLFEFGRWILISTAISFLASQSDRLLLGKAVPMLELGVYSIAANLAGLPIQVIGQVSQKVFFPVVASAMRKADHDPASIRRSRTKLLLVLAPGIALAVAMVPAAVDLLYDHRYHRVGQLTAYLSIGTWIGAISQSYGVVLLAAGRPKLLSLGNGAKTAIFSALMFPIAARWGVEGVALVVGLSELGFLVVAQLGCRREHVVTWAADAGITALGAGFVAAYLGLHHVVLLVVPSPWVALGVVTAIALGSAGVLAKKIRLLS